MLTFEYIMLSHFGSTRSTTSLHMHPSHRACRLLAQLPLSTCNCSCLAALEWERQQSLFLAQHSKADLGIVCRQNVMYPDDKRMLVARQMPDHMLALYN